MKQIQFANYATYIAAQKHTILKRGLGPYFCDIEILRIARWIGQNGVLPIRLGVCHGARNGQECNELMKHFPHARIFGTDLFPFSGKSIITRGKAAVYEWDFNKPNRKWVGAFDLVYTNSLDHSDDPEASLKIWLNQLKPKGVLFVQWNRSDMDVKGGDCFGATPLEYIDLLNAVGRVIDLIYVRTEWQRGNPLRRHGLECIVFVVQKKG